MTSFMTRNIRITCVSLFALILWNGELSQGDVSRNLKQRLLPLTLCDSVFKRMNFVFKNLDFKRRNWLQEKAIGRLKW